MTRTIIRVFDSPQEAIEALRELKQIGVEPGEISFLACNKEGWAPVHLAEGASDDDLTTHGVDAGMSLGGLIGGGLGALAGLSALAIPGAGPAIAAGWLLSLATGALGGAAVGGVAGGLMAALKAEGITEEDAQICMEAVRRGGSVIAVRCEATEAARIRDVLQKYGGVDPEARGQVYREAGWLGFDPEGRPYGASEIAEERQRAKTGQPLEPRSFASQASAPPEAERSPDPRAAFAPTWQPGRDV